MTQQYTPNIGQEPAADARRDAIHFAVAPVIAGELLEPGQHVGMVDGKFYWSVNDEQKIGVVDPFLKESVERGHRFWLMLYPNTVTSLRHVWEHPAFKPKLPIKEACHE